MPDLNKIVEDLSKLTVVEAAELSKTLEEKWGVSAAAPVAAAAPAAAAGGGAATAGGEAAAAQEDFTVILEEAGSQKIAVIKEVRALNSSLGLKEAKDLVDATPATLLEKASKETAEKAKAALEAVGAKVTIK